jgi:hypothetical protein
MAHGEIDKARIVAEAVDQIGREILALPATNGTGANGQTNIEGRSGRTGANP